MWGSIRGGLFAVCCIGGISHSFAGDDRDQNRPLKGVFRGSHSGNCLESQGGFTPNLTFQLNGWAGKYSEIFWGRQATNRTRGFNKVFAAQKLELQNPSFLFQEKWLPSF